MTKANRRAGAVTSWLRPIVGAVFFGVSTIAHVIVLLAVAVLKAVLPLSAAQRICNAMLMSIAESWIGVNTWGIRNMTHTRIVVDSDVALDYDGHYLVLANHQSWVDIPMLQAVFNRKIPLLRFFLKSVLIWVPFLGLAWWALDFPFMKRYSREKLAKHPELAGRDIEATRRTCEKFRGMPVSIMNFVEGTRFTQAKHREQRSPYIHLLKPRAGGVAFVLAAMGNALHAVLDITLAYPDGRPTFGDLFTDRVPEVRVYIRRREIPAALTSGDYQNDPAARERVQTWINTVWAEKDALLSLATKP